MLEKNTYGYVWIGKRGSIPDTAYRVSPFGKTVCQVGLHVNGRANPNGLSWWVKDADHQTSSHTLFASLGEANDHAEGLKSGRIKPNVISVGAPMQERLPVNPGVDRINVGEMLQARESMGYYE